MSNVQDMATAPTDGTCILILTHMYGYDREKCKQVRNGTSWTECRFVDGQWQSWGGNKTTRSTWYIDPIKWAPLPEPRRQELAITWLGACPVCSHETMQVFTEKGDVMHLFQGDPVECPGCRIKGTIETDDGYAHVVWKGKKRVRRFA